MSKEIKVTDKRMFTPEGELREEYRFLQEKSTSEQGEQAPEAASRTAEPPAAPLRTDPRQAPPEPVPGRGRAQGPAPQDFGFGPGPAPGGGYGPGFEADYGYDFEEPDPTEAGAARLDLPGTAPGMGPSFFDLVAMLAEPAAVYLGDVPLPDGQDAENLEMARVHIDLLDVLRQKTIGNLTAQESAFLEDLLYRLKVRYVQKGR